MGYAIASASPTVKNYKPTDLVAITSNALPATFNANVFTFRSSIFGKLCFLEYAFSFHFTDPFASGFLVTIPKELNADNVVSNEPTGAVLNGQSGLLNIATLSPDPDTPQLIVDIDGGQSGGGVLLIPTDATYFGHLFYKLA
jgi:hypothetical protein